MMQIEMNDDIIYGLSEISLYLSNIGENDFAKTIGDACKKLELLKEKEPIEPKRTVDEYGQVLSCGNCGAWFEVQFQKYCHECGRAVKWDEN